MEARPSFFPQKLNSSGRRYREDTRVTSNLGSVPYASTSIVEI